MADRRERELERHALAGDPDALVDLVRRVERRHGVEAAALRLAGLVGDDEARRLGRGPGRQLPAGDVRVTYTWVEPFAGAAAVALRLVGGPTLAPPVAWMGGKRRYARRIVDAMGVPAGRPARVVLADAGPWGWVWPLLLHPASAARVAEVLRGWTGEHPRELWDRLAAEPPREDLHGRAAQWLWLQARTASAVPCWWDGGRPKSKQDTGSTWRMGEERSKAKRGTRTIAQAGGKWVMGSERRGRPQPIGQNGRDEGEGGFRFPGTIADRVEAIAESFARIQVTVHPGDATGALLGWHAGGAHLPAFVYLDPPYAGATGYGWDFPRDAVLTMARTWRDVGATVAVSEAEPLGLPGWHHIELTRPGGKPEWLTLSRPPARIPATQRTLFPA